MAELGKLARPVVGAGARLHADQAARQVGDEFEQFGTRDFGAHQCRLACLVHTMHSKDVLRQIDSYGYDSHDFPSQSKLMKRFASPSWHFVAVNRNPHRARLAWDGEVPFIR